MNKQVRTYANFKKILSDLQVIGTFYDCLKITLLE